MKKGAFPSNTFKHTQRVDLNSKASRIHHIQGCCMREGSMATSLPRGMTERRIVVLLSAPLATVSSHAGFALWRRLVLVSIASLYCFLLSIIIQRFHGAIWLQA